MPMIQKTLAEVLTVARASAGTVFDAAGNLTTVAANQPRFDYDPISKAFRGLLVEEQRTNLAINSARFGAGSLWTVNAGTTVTDGVFSAPDNAVSGARVDFTADFAYLSHCQSSIAAGQIFAVSLFARRNSGRAVMRLAQGDSSQLIKAVLDTATQTLGHKETKSATLVGLYVFPAGPNWDRYVIVGSLALATTAAGIMLVREQSAETGIAIWGAQIEIGAFATSYIPTNGAATTRAADVVQVIDGLWRGNSAHTLYVESSRRQIQPAGTISCAAALRQLPSGGIYIESGQTQPSANRLRVSAVGWAELANIQTAADAVPDRVYRHAITVSAGRAAYVRDGALVGAAAPAELPPVNALHIGSSGAGNYLNGHIRQVQYADRVLSDADLIAVSLKGLAA